MVLSGIDQADRKRYEELFKKLDVNNNGKIDLEDLKAQLGCEKYAQVSVGSCFFVLLPFCDLILMISLLGINKLYASFRTELSHH